MPDTAGSSRFLNEQGRKFREWVSNREKQRTFTVRELQLLLVDYSEAMDFEKHANHMTIARDIIYKTIKYPKISRKFALDSLLPLMTIATQNDYKEALNFNWECHRREMLKPIDGSEDNYGRRRFYTKRERQDEW
ncbi:Oidioi.mRNA.OKI2018_I69.chr1.g3233.t1.cds [Oikopleura dioica]|uniref:Oidioi.mRNA.OKI2018_I69.chr1.g3233.t1.cds n=1 Tax=Oikopleura dioica TaxID=34765 RepID=A0ABN7SYY7_OIKDI|nr:Oidioi.mRNA.OKI2018_I69.chr1.g3233.t1.cds [Oikopleura dioica]